MSAPQNFQNLYGTVQLTVPASGSFSGSVFMNGQALVGLIIPGTFTAAPVSFQHAIAPPHDGGTWTNLYSGTTEYSIGVLYGTATMLLPPADLPGLLWLRLRTGLAAGGTVQSAAGSFVGLTRPI